MQRRSVKAARSIGTKCFFALTGAAALCIMTAATASAASIKGTVQFTGGAVPQKKLAVTVDQYVCGKEKEADLLILSPQGGIRNAVVWLESPAQGAKRENPAPVVQMDQKQCVFTPRVVVVPVGGTVEFLNSDHLLHNVHTVTKENPSVNRAQPRGRTIPVIFSKPEIIRVKCDLHPWMLGWVVVTDHPFHAVTGVEGEFTLNNVPPGKYTLHVWQESLGTSAKEVTVSSKEVANVTVEMTRK